jgi:hypothetical protein
VKQKTYTDAELAELVEIIRNTPKDRDAADSYIKDKVSALVEAGFFKPEKKKKRRPFLTGKQKVQNHYAFEDLLGLIQEKIDSGKAYKKATEEVAEGIMDGPSLRRLVPQYLLYVPWYFNGEWKASVVPRKCRARVLGAMEQMTEILRGTLAIPTNPPQIAPTIKADIADLESGILELRKQLSNNP